ncbi:hypothetical protein [Sphingopyxis sp.]|jgi:hypothetical protein|uniref:hypothetical protein n=1 Tax=Sphingomonadales TaxID=204457 RepID=UPI003F6F74A7
MDNIQRHRLLILACSATKRSRPGWIPAVDRYDGPLWQTLRAIGPDRQDTKVAVLSAQYRFIDSRSPIENYDARLTTALAERMIEGGIAMRWPRPPPHRKPDIYGNYARCEIASLTDHGQRPFTEIGLAGGHLYLRVMHSFVSEFRGRNYISADAPLTEINAPIGIMRRDLRVWLEHRAGDLT